MMRQLVSMVLCLALVLFVGCSTKEGSKSAPSEQVKPVPVTSSDSSTEAEVKNVEASSEEVDKVEQDLGAEYLDSLEQDLDSVDSLDLS